MKKKKGELTVVNPHLLNNLMQRKKSHLFSPHVDLFLPSPPAALSERPFYEEWWFLLVMALVGLILILVLVFALLLHGHSTKYKACSTGLCF